MGTSDVLNRYRASRKTKPKSEAEDEEDWSPASDYRRGATPKRDTETEAEIETGPAATRRATARARTLAPVDLAGQKHAYGQFPEWVITSGRWKAMTKMEAKVYGLMIAGPGVHHRTGTCRVSDRDLAVALGVPDHRERIRQALDGLQGLGTIKRAGRQGQKTVWQIVRAPGKKQRRTR